MNNGDSCKLTDLGKENLTAFELGLEVDFTIWRCLQCVYERRSRLVPPQTSKFVNGDDHDFILAVQGYVLGTMAAHASDKLTELGFRILQTPPVTRRGVWASRATAWDVRLVRITGHTD